MQREDILASEKGLLKVITPSIVSHLSCYGAVCSRHCLSTLSVTKQGLPKSPADQKLANQNNPFKKQINKNCLQRQNF